MDIQNRIQTMLNPKSVAIIGASRTIGKWGFTFVNHLSQGGYNGPIYPVNPSGGSIIGQKIYKSLNEISDPVDLAFILLPPHMVSKAIAECGEKKIPSCVVITAGFKEVGASGKDLEAELVEAATKADVAFLGPNCGGISSPYPMSLYCMMQPTFPPVGGIAILSQSGNIAGSIQHMLWKQDLGISRCICLGNQAQLKAEDFLEYFITDDQTKVVIAYVESVSDGKRFMDVSARLTRVKPFIMIKGGQTDKGVSAAKSHTGAIAGSGTIFEGMCSQHGITFVNDVEDMLDTAAAFISQPLPESNRVGIVANGGGWGVLAADACVKMGLDVIDLPSETLQALDKRLPAWWNRQNPVDLVAGMSRGAFFKAAEILCQSDIIDGLIVLGFGYNNPIVSALKSHPDTEDQNFTQYIKDALYSDERGMNFLLELVSKYNKPVLLSSEFIVGADRDQNEAVLELRKKNFVIYPTAYKSAKVLSRLVRYKQYLKTLV
jgi:acyl-CoA synthetase (NDP forming)